MPRIDGRANDELRPLDIIPGYLRNPAGSAMMVFGNTRVLTAATFANQVPPWMKAQKVPGGWVTCEYSMLPAATAERTKREATSGKQNGRTVEIQRLIGRSLRMSADLLKLGEHTVYIDCDVIEADGGTRCASICGAAAALAIGCRRFAPDAFKELVAAVSVGIVNGEPMLDLCYAEDSNAEVDMNIVMSESGKLIEVQGTAEDKPFSRQQLNELIDLAESGLQQIFKLQREAIERAFA